MSTSRRPASPAALARAQTLVPALAEMLENHDPCLKGLDFNAIEASSAAIGDVMARLLMAQAVAQQPDATASEVRTAFEQAQRKAGKSPATPILAGEPTLRRIRKKRTLKTIRGPVSIEREYLYFPALGAGIFPPRRTP